MRSEDEWLFYTQAAWNVDQATHIAKTLIAERSGELSYPQRLIQFAAYNFCLASYFSPFMRSETRSGKPIKITADEFVPDDMLGIHEQIKNYRNKILAPADVSHLCAPSFKDGFRFTSTDVYLSAPPIEKSLALFLEVSTRLIEKSESL